MVTAIEFLLQEGKGNTQDEMEGLCCGEYQQNELRIWIGGGQD